MRKAIILLIVCLLGISLSYAENKPFQIRLVLTEEEAKTTPYDVYTYQLYKGPQQLLVSKEVALANEDIKEAYIIRAKNSYKQYPEAYKTVTKGVEKTLKIDTETRKEMYSQPTIKLLFTDRRKLEEFSRKNLNRQCAIVFDGRLLMAPFIREPLTLSAMSIWAKNDEAALEIVQQLGFEPKFLYE